MEVYTYLLTILISLQIPFKVYNFHLGIHFNRYPKDITRRNYQTLTKHFYKGACLKRKRHYLNEIQDTLCKDAVRVQKGANSHLQSTANIAVCRHHFLALHGKDTQ